jgi:uncharacterized membrane protein
MAATVHIYRGLMDRCYAWRVRIDNPTNWAVITSGTVTPFVLGDPAISPAVLLLIMFLMLAFLLIEARRYRYYDLWGTWVRLMEVDFFATALVLNQATLGEAWQRLMIRDMTYPHFKTSLLSAVGRRLRDNYIVIFLFLLFTWMLKLVIHPVGDPRVHGYLAGAAIGPLSGGAVCAIVGFMYMAILLLAAATSGEREPGVEVLSRYRVLQKLASPDQQPVSRRRWSAVGHSPPDVGRSLNAAGRDGEQTIDLED